MLTPVVLGVLAVVLAGPLPWALSRWTGLRRTPAAAMLLWQSTALAAVLAALGAGLSLATDRLWQPPVAAGDVVVAGLAGTASASTSSPGSTTGCRCSSTTCRWPTACPA